tara:strand:+ start:61 stop:900 length:840 start_codon:yes stop_codon:yes gene_type:complete
MKKSNKYQKRVIKKKNYSKSQFKTVITPSWQRWKSEKNINELALAISENGQLRDVLICVTEDGTKILTDGAHMVIAIFERLCLAKISVTEIYVIDEEEARETFISFNTKGKTLSVLDYVVSFAANYNNDYKKFLSDVMQSPKSKNEADKVHAPLFTVPSLIKIFLGENTRVKSGIATLPKKYERVLDLVEYLSNRYVNDGRIVSHLRKNGKTMKLNGGSIIPVFMKLKRRINILEKTNKQILDMLVDFTTYHYNSTDSPSFTKDSVDLSFSVYLQAKGY